MEIAHGLDGPSVLYYNTGKRDCQRIFGFFSFEKAKSRKILKYLFDSLKYSFSIFKFSKADFAV